VVAHELGHSFTAIAKGIPVHSITLFIFGGVASLSQEIKDAKTEFLVAIAGPAVSLFIAVVSAGGLYLLHGVSEQFSDVFEYLALANGILVVFNLVPGFPLDGGRVFRSIVWGITHSMERATRIATRLGIIIGYLFIIGGVFVVFTGDVISGIWFGAIGWFLQNAAAQSMQQFQMQSTVQGVVAGTLMQHNPPVVDPGVPIDRLVEHYFIGQNLRGVPVVQQDVLLGIITLTDLRSTPQSEWPSLRVADRMTPRYRLITVTPETPIGVAMQAMSEHDVHQIPVVQNGMLLGLLTRSTIIRYLQMSEHFPERAKV